ncbi:MAG: hypothetical protein OXT65_10065 [Alphaproteobacteria bacterium]|nr:hypothetical protein [Alphaproteobacteria bacterium]
MASFGDIMAAGGWAVFSLCCAFFMAAFALVNQYVRQPGLLIVFGMRLGVTVTMLPFALLIPWPPEPAFYIIVFCTAGFAVWGDACYLNASAKYGGGVAARMMPYSIWGAFLLWIPFDLGILGRYAANPLNTAIILAALAGCVFFAQRQRKCEISRSALLDMIPFVISASVTTVLNKLAMGYGTHTGAVYGYMLFQCFCASTLLGALLWWKHRKKALPNFDKKRLGRASLLLAGIWITSMFFKNYTMVYTPNPAYFLAITLTAPVFIALYYLVVRHKETADVKSGMGVVACAILLALASVRG